MWLSGCPSHLFVQCGPRQGCVVNALPVEAFVVVVMRVASVTAVIRGYIQLLSGLDFSAY